jgi:hypothetical protein
MMLGTCLKASLRIRRGSTSPRGIRKNKRCTLERMRKRRERALYKASTSFDYCSVSRTHSFAFTVNFLGEASWG